MIDRPFRVVIVGAGFGGLAAATALAKAPVEVTIIDQRNHHVFQPLLYQVATAALSPADIAGPIRAILAGQDNAHVRLGRVVGIDRGMREVLLDNGDRLPFDKLIIATGARHSYFGRDDWQRYAPGLKSLEDATAVRRRVLLAMEHAETESDKDRRHALLTFAVIGGGPTGLEMAGAIAELARRSVSRDFRSITPHCSRVMLIEAGPRLLPQFPEDLSEAACQSVEELGVEVRLGQPVTQIDQDGLMVGNERIDCATIVWAAGVRASPAGAWLGAPCDTAGRVLVDQDCSVPGDKDIFVIGDTANMPDTNGVPLPGIAPVAKQQGRYVAKVIERQLAGHAAKPFRYRHFGNLATIGRSRAVIDFGRIRMKGFIAWLLWSTAHVYFLVGFRNRLAVGANLAWNYLTFARHARLITGTDGDEMPFAAPAE